MGFRCWAVSLYLILLLPRQVEPGKNLKALPTLSYSRPGHVKLALYTTLLGWADNMCNDVIENFSDIQFFLPCLNAQREINSDPYLLGNITLGLDLIEDCYRPVATVGQGLKVLRNTSGIENIKMIKTGEDSKVVGIVGPVSSSTSVSLVPILNLFNMAAVSCTASSDELSNRSKYPNFFRLIPSDSLQSQVMVDFMAALNWNYFSIVHSENSYGYNGVKFLRMHARRKDICIAETYAIADDFVKEDYISTVKRIWKHSMHRPHTVVLFNYAFHTRSLLEAADELNVTNIFWILSEATNPVTIQGLGHTIVNSFMVDWYAVLSESFQASIRDATAVGHEDNRYFQEIWMQFFGCDIRNGLAKDNPCIRKTIGEIPGFGFSPASKFSGQIIHVYATAIHNLVMDNCPEKLKDPVNVLDCVTSERLLDYVKTVGLKTNEGIKQFDSTGGMKIDFSIYQIRPTIEFEMVGIWRHRTGLFDWVKELQWGTPSMPEVVCAQPCLPGEFYIQGELPCCWECHRCRDNEYVANNATTCRTCPYLKWPVNGTFTECEDIPPSYMQWSDVYSLGLTILACLGLVFNLLLIHLVVKHRERRVIKGSVVPMVSVILFGILLIYVDVLLLITKPDRVICTINRVIFSFSCTLIFGPLLLKTHRIYLVFKASSKLKRVSKLAKESSQYALTFLLLALQVGILAVAAFLWPIQARHSMPVVTKKYVELHCDQDQLGLLVPLSYNLLLILLCSLLAFLTRKLPDNFNETWYIFLSVSTTLFVWIAFLPTYYAAFYAYHKAALLALALTLNGFVTQVCLFGPKVYALFYVDDKDIKITDFNSTTFDKPATMATNVN